MKRINVEGVARLPAFSHAVVAGGFIFVSGTLGTRPGALELVPGGIGPETEQALRNMETILAACGATLADLVRVDVFLRDENSFQQMNEAYCRVIGDQPPARITVYRAGLALGAAVELIGIAVAPAAQVI